MQPRRAATPSRLVKKRALPRIAPTRTEATKSTWRRSSDMPKLSDTMKNGVLQKWRKKEGDKVSPGRPGRRGRDRQGDDGLRAFDEGVLLKLLVADGATCQSARRSRSSARPARTSRSWSRRRRRAAKRRAGEAAAAGRARPLRPRSRRPRAAAKPGRRGPPNGQAAAPAPKPRAGADARPPRPPPGRARAGACRRQGARVAAGAKAGDRARHRPARHPGHRPGRPHRRARREGRRRGWRRGRRDRHAAEEAPQTSAPRVSAADAACPPRSCPSAASEARPAPAAPGRGHRQAAVDDAQDDRARLVEAKTDVPHFYLTADVDMDAAMAFREQVDAGPRRQAVGQRPDLKACALALRRMPEANASFTEEAIIQLRAASTSAWRWRSRTAWSRRSSATPT